MAIDSREKRAASLGVGRPWMRDKLPGANDQAWRIASGNAYPGITLAAQQVITIDFVTSLDGTTDGTRKVIATLTPGDAGVVYEFEETEVS